LGDTLEIKTRVSHKHFVFGKLASQLWVPQTPKLVHAHYTRVVFEDPVVEDVTQEIRDWEGAHQNDLRKLVALIKRIRDAAKECGGRAVLHCDGMRDRLLISKDKTTKMMLPADLYSKWETAETLPKDEKPKNGTA
jgi:hypothetical protein